MCSLSSPRRGSRSRRSLSATPSTEVEQLITVPIEDQLNGIEGLTDLRSKSVAQLSAIVMFFEAGTDELRARQLVAERLSQITADTADLGQPAVHDAGRCRRPVGS